MKPAVVFKKFSLNKSSVTSAYLGLILVTVLSKVLGFLREAVIAYKFGVDVDFDVFLVALTIPNMIYSILLYAVPNIVVPLFSKSSTDEHMLGEYSKSFFWPYFLGLTVIQVLYLIFCSTLIKLIAGDMDAENLALAIELAQYFSLFIYFSSLYCAFKGIFHVKKWFIIPAVAPFFIHFFVIVFALLWADSIGVKSIVLGMGVGSFFQFAVMLAYMNKKRVLKFFKFGFNFSKELIAPFIIVFMVEILGQTYTLIDRSFAAEIPQGYISGLNYANILNMLPISILGITLGTIIFPDFSIFIQNNEKERLKKRFADTMLYVTVIGIVSFIILFIGSEFIVKLLLQRGQFDANATDITSGFLKMASLGIPFIMIHTIVTKLYLSLKYEKVLLLFTMIAILSKFILASLFVEDAWYWGIALSTVIAFVINDVLMLLFLWRKKVFVS